MNKKIIVAITITLLFLGASISAQAGSNNLLTLQQWISSFFRSSTSSMMIHFWVRGFVNFSDGSSGPNGVPVKITDLNNGNSMVVYTQQTVKRPGYYLINIEDLSGNDGDTIFVNVSYGGCAGNNSVVVNTSEQGTNVYCNVTIYGNLPPNVPNKPSGPTSGSSGITYTYTTYTNDSDGDDVYYWFDWDDGSNSGWLGPYSSGQSGNASHSWNASGTYQVKAKAKDEHGAQLGVCWSNPLNVTIGNQPPNTPNIPSGPTSGNHGVSYNYSTNTTDPNGDNVSYGWDWDDGDPIEWSGWYASGATCVMSHSWDDPGTYDVRVKAKDTSGNESGWSPTLTVLIENQAPNTPNIPSGPILLNIGVSGTYSTSAVDPDGDQVQYRFDWDANGSHDYSSWTSFVPSGTTASKSHSWSSGGTYTVKAQARDEYNATSGWSSGLTVFINSPPNTPSDPEPEDGATGVDINADLSWNCSDPDGDSLTYNVYFEANDPTPDILVSENQTQNTYDPGTMNYNTHYYWKIVAWDNHNASATGPIWDFITMSEPNSPPYTPNNPNPENESTNIDIDTNLSWTGGDPDEGDTVVYDVYLEADDPTPDLKVADDINETTFNPETLEYETIYYWQIYARDNHGAVTKSPVWHFTTENTPIPNLDCSGSLGWTKVKPGSTVTGNFTVENIGEPFSELDWEVETWPSWGTWTFTPSSGTDLTPEDGTITVQVTVIAPNDPNQEFTGDVKVVNSENSSDYEIIPVSLVTPVNQQSFVLLSKNLMTSSFLVKLASIKMLLQQFSTTSPSFNIATPSSVSVTEDVEDTTSSTSSSETQQSESQDVEIDNEQTQNTDYTSTSDSSSPSEESSTSSTISEEDVFSESSSSRSTE